MKIFNIRKGLATNSSSKHSILLLPAKKTIKSLGIDDNTNDGDFGWGFFTAASNKSKNEYFNLLLKSSLETIVEDEDEIRRIMNDDFGVDYDTISGHIDHQSMITLPSSFDGKNININFAKDLRDFLISDRVVILGGNDNDDNNHDLLDEGVVFDNLLKEDSSKNWIARKDKDYWTMFNKKNGNKVRFSFDDSTQEPKKATYPELVDIKITDYCPYSCDFCYQDSKKDGMHASLDFIKVLAKEFSDKEVFEVALGGGETTLHPQFEQILDIFNQHNVVVNFTTRNYSLMRSEKFKSIIDKVGALALSVSSIEDVEKLMINKTLYQEEETYYGDPKKIKAQYIMGTTSLSEFEEIIKKLKTFNIDVTLLGFKDNGRGNSYQAQDYEGWLNIIKKLNDSNQCPVIYIDTALAKESEKELKDSGVPSYSYYVKEGAFSLYVDAVKQFMYPSSYIGLEQGCEFKKDTWVNNYKTMEAEPKPRKKIINIKSVS